MFYKNNKKANIEDSIFQDLSSDWWNPKGKFKVLHNFNKTRVPYIVNQVNLQFKLDNNWSTLDILDVGCGGGLISEEIAKKHANITAIDTSSNSINIAKSHAFKNNLNINYLNKKVEDLNKEVLFDVILLMEVLEHINDINNFLKHIFALLKKDGMIIFSTINRNIQSLILAKFLAEYVLRWVPKDIHNYKNFIKPMELNQFFLRYHFSINHIKGLKYNLKYNKWDLIDKPKVNYIGSAIHI